MSGAIGTPRRPVSVAVAAAAGAASHARDSTGAAIGAGPVRLWQGVLIQSLDPLPRRGRAHHAHETRVGLTAPSLAARELRSAGAGARPINWILSNERTLTRWAYAEGLAPIHAHPHVQARGVAHLRWYTEDGFPEVYPLLRLHRDGTGQQWVKLRIPMRPDGRVGWVRREALGSFHTTEDLLVVDRDRLLMELFTDGLLRWSAPVSVGKPSTPTPRGSFWIRKRFKIFDPGSGYWPYAFGTADHSTIGGWPTGGMVGIRGPDVEPGPVPGRASSGCLRLQVADDTWLAEHLGLGTPFLVR
jgi:hypothetical protein